MTRQIRGSDGTLARRQDLTPWQRARAEILAGRPLQRDERLVYFLTPDSASRWLADAVLTGQVRLQARSTCGTATVIRILYVSPPSESRPRWRGALNWTIGLSALFVPVLALVWVLWMFRYAIIGVLLLAVGLVLLGAVIKLFSEETIEVTQIVRIKR